MVVDYDVEGSYETTRGRIPIRGSFSRPWRQGLERLQPFTQKRTHFRRRTQPDLRIGLSVLATHQHAESARTYRIDRAECGFIAEIVAEIGYRAS